MYSLSRCTYIECIEYHGPTMNIVPWYIYVCTPVGCMASTVHKAKLFFVMLTTTYGVVFFSMYEQVLQW
jgi:hypothetical protein